MLEICQPRGGRPDRSGAGLYPESSVPPAEDPGSRSAATVLLVDPDEDARSICRAILEHHGFRVVEAADGLTGLRLARNICPDVVLLEVHLPGMSGWEVARTLRGDPRLAARVVILTSLVTPAAYQEAKRIGCSGYLTKPISPLRVVEEVERVLCRGSRNSLQVEPTVSPLA